jgi:curved DNA-binding protein CbpA
MSIDLYALLGVADSAPASDIRRAYRRLARVYHPDITGGDAEKEIKFKALNAAYEVLGDVEKRASYDRHRGARRARTVEDRGSRTTEEPFDITQVPVDVDGASLEGIPLNVLKAWLLHEHPDVYSRGWIASKPRSSTARVRTPFGDFSVIVRGFMDLNVAGITQEEHSDLIAMAARNIRRLLRTKQARGPGDEAALKLIAPGAPSGLPRRRGE